MSVIDEDNGFNDSGFSEWEKLFSVDDAEFSSSDFSFIPHSVDSSLNDDAVDVRLEISRKKNVLNPQQLGISSDEASTLCSTDWVGFEPFKAMLHHSFSEFSQVNSVPSITRIPNESLDTTISLLNPNSSYQLLNACSKDISGDVSMVGTPEGSPENQAMVVSSQSSESQTMIVSSQESSLSQAMVLFSQGNSLNESVASQEDTFSQSMVISSQGSSGSQKINPGQENSGNQKITSSQESLLSQKMITSSQESSQSQKMITSSQESSRSEKMITSSQEYCASDENIFNKKLSWNKKSAEDTLIELQNLLQTSKEMEFFQSDKSIGNACFKSRMYCNRCTKLNKNRILSIRRRELIIAKKENALKTLEKHLAAREASILKRETILKRKYSSYEECLTSSKKIKSKIWTGDQN